MNHIDAQIADKKGTSLKQGTKCPICHWHQDPNYFECSCAEDILRDETTQVGDTSVVGSLAATMHNSDDPVIKVKSAALLLDLLDPHEVSTSSSENNGGSTDYYKFDSKWVECGDVIEARDMNYNQGNIFKAAFCFNQGRHSGTSYERELNKIIYFAQRELNIIKEQ